MISDKERAELAEICYIIVDRECVKPVEEMDTALIESCLSFAARLLGIPMRSSTELENAEQSIMNMSAHRRRRIRVRVIAAILAAILLLGTTVYAFTDWLDAVFGHEEIWQISPGETLVAEDVVVEKPADIVYFDSIAELAEFIDEPVYLPMDMPEEYVLDSITVNEYDERMIVIEWVKDGVKASSAITLSPSYCDEEKFMSSGYEFDYYTKDGHAIEYIFSDPRMQALGFIGENEYAILANDIGELEKIIDHMELIE